VTEEQAVEVKQEGPEAPTKAVALIPLRIEEADLVEVTHNVRMMEKAVQDVLEAEIDYGIVPGIKEPFLFDPGASKVRSFFDVYPEHSIMADTDEDGLRTLMVEARLIFRKTGKVVASGVGACSMKEAKYRYIWAWDPMEYGFEKDDCRKKNFAKKGSGQPYWKYRVPNPECDGLINTILKMASKRAEVDATQNLPGVSAAITKLKQQWTGKGGKKDLTYAQFWGEVTKMGLDEAQAHAICGVTSMKDWEESGRTLTQAIQEIRNWLTEKSKRGAPKGGREDQPEEPPEEGLFKEATPKRIYNLDMSKVKTREQFDTLCKNVFLLSQEDALKLAGYSPDADMASISWKEAFTQVCGIKGAIIKEEEKRLEIY